MFEQLSRFQPGMAQQICSQIEGGTFSQVSLFGGERYSLRLSFALETIRALSCTEGGRDLCSCESCRKFANLAVSNVVIVSQRDHVSIIETNLATFSRLANDFSRNLVIRSIRTLLLQYHPALFGGTLTATQNTLSDAASNLNEQLLELANKRDVEVKEAKKISDELRTSLKSLYAASRKSSTISINQVRSLSEWTSQTSMGDGKRFIIIEALEDTNTSARNSLLKMLEEPAKDTYFFLISEYPGRIMQTILSRVRRYAFPPLTESALAAYLQPYYLGDRHYDSLELFYLESGGMDVKKSRELAHRLSESVVYHRQLGSAELSALIQEVDQMQSQELLFKALLEEFHQALLAKVITLDRMQRFSQLLNTTSSNAKLFNQNAKLTLESLYYRLMEER